MALPTSSVFVAYALAAWAVLRLVSRIVVNRRYAAEQARLGCKPPPSHRNRLPLGLDEVMARLKADREMYFPTYIFARFVADKSWTMRDHIFGEEIFQTCDPKVIQSILTTQFKEFGLGHERRDNFMPLLGSGIFTQDPEHGWDHSRAMIRPQFAREQVSDLDLEERHVQNMMRALPVDANGWVDVDLQVLFFRLTLDSATEFLFGQSADSQLHALPDQAREKNVDLSGDGNQFGLDFDKGQSWLAMRTRLQSLYWVATSKDFRKACRDTHRFADHFVRLALARSQKDGTGLEKGEKKKYIFLDALVAQTRDPTELRSQTLNLLLGGRDTTASMMGWLFYELARNPAVFAKLRAVILDSFGTYSAPHDLTFSALKSCQFLQFCNNEILRLYPVVPVNTRQALRDTVIPTGGGPDGTSPFFVRKDQHVQYCVHAMHRRKDLWGDDAEVFNPERWLGRRPGWEYLPFNGGPRICPGQQFALTKTSYVAVRLIQRFDVLQNRDDAPLPLMNLTLTNCSGTGAKVRLHAAPS